MSRERTVRLAGSDRSRFIQVVLADTVRAVEHDAPLEDSAEMRQAFAQADDTETRLLVRAQLLAERLKLDAELARWQDTARLICLGLALLACLTAYGVAASVIGSGRTVNAVTAFFALLAMPTLTLLIWLAAVPGISGTLFGQLSFGNMLLGVVARLPGARSAYALTMARSTHSVLQRARLLPWAFGQISHAIWALSFVLILAALWFGFSFAQYRLTWETTILEADFFVRFITLTGALPHWLGFPLPDTTTLLNPTASGSDHRAWAWWLIGCALVYGLLPRLLLIPVCWLAWRRGVQRLSLDASEPYYRKLIARFDDMAQSHVVDVEHKGDAAFGRRTKGTTWSDARFVIGFELPPELAFPTSALAASSERSANTNIARLAGTAEERRVILDQLAQIGPRVTLVVCHANTSPDRGTERFLRDVSAQSARTALLLLHPQTEDRARAQTRWQDWLARTELTPLALMPDEAHALTWLEQDHD